MSRVPLTLREEDLAQAEEAGTTGSNSFHDERKEASALHGDGEAPQQQQQQQQQQLLGAAHSGMEDRPISPPRSHRGRLPTSLPPLSPSSHRVNTGLASRSTSNVFVAASGTYSAGTNGGGISNNSNGESPVSGALRPLSGRAGISTAGDRFFFEKRLGGDAWERILSREKCAVALQEVVKDDLCELFNYGASETVLRRDDIQNIAASPKVREGQCNGVFIAFDIRVGGGSGSGGAGRAPDFDDYDMRIELCSFPLVMDFHDQKARELKSDSATPAPAPAEEPSAAALTTFDPLTIPLSSETPSFNEGRLGASGGADTLILSGDSFLGGAHPAAAAAVRDDRMDIAAQTLDLNTRIISSSSSDEGEAGAGAGGSGNVRADPASTAAADASFEERRQPFEEYHSSSSSSGSHIDAYSGYSPLPFAAAKPRNNDGSKSPAGRGDNSNSSSNNNKRNDNKKDDVDDDDVDSVHSSQLVSPMTTRLTARGGSHYLLDMHNRQTLSENPFVSASSHAGAPTVSRMSNLTSNEDSQQDFLLSSNSSDTSSKAHGGKNKSSKGENSIETNKDKKPAPKRKKSTTTSVPVKRRVAPATSPPPPPPAVRGKKTVVVPATQRGGSTSNNSDRTNPISPGKRRKKEVDGSAAKPQPSKAKAVVSSRSHNSNNNTNSRSASSTGGVPVVPSLVLPVKNADPSAETTASSSKDNTVTATPVKAADAPQVESISVRSCIQVGDGVDEGTDTGDGCAPDKRAQTRCNSNDNSESPSPSRTDKAAAHRQSKRTSPGSSKQNSMERFSGGDQVPARERFKIKQRIMPPRLALPPSAKARSNTNNNRDGETDIAHEEKAPQVDRQNSGNRADKESTTEGDSPMGTAVVAGDENTSKGALTETSKPSYVDPSAFSPPPATPEHSAHRSNNGSSNHSRSENDDDEAGNGDGDHNDDEEESSSSSSRGPLGERPRPSKRKKSKKSSKKRSLVVSLSSTYSHSHAQSLSGSVDGHRRPLLLKDSLKLKKPINREVEEAFLASYSSNPAYRASVDSYSGSDGAVDGAAGSSTTRRRVLIPAGAEATEGTSPKPARLPGPPKIKRRSSSPPHVGASLLSS